MKLKFLKTWLDKKTGKVYACFRRKGHARVMLPGVLGSAEFMAAYFTALNGGTPLAIAGTIGSDRTRAGSVADVIAQYIAADFGACPTVKPLKDTSKTQHRHQLNRFRDKHGHRSIDVPVEFINEQIADLTPASAKHWINAIRRLMQFAMRKKLVKADPTAGIKIKAAQSDGHATWTEELIEKFRAHWAPGTNERLMFELALNTCQRISDVVCMGHQHIKDGGIRIRQIKTGAWVYVPMHPDLEAAIAMASKADLTFLRNAHGRAYTAHRGSLVLANAAREALGVEGFTAHGLRKACAVRLADVGCEIAEIMAIGGWKTMTEVERYIREFNRDNAARKAVAKLAGRKAVAS